MNFEMLKRFAKFVKVKWDVSSGAIRIAEPPDFDEEYVSLDWEIRPDDVREFSKIEGLCFTTEKPTTPGWYWVKNLRSRLTGARVIVDEGVVYVDRYSCSDPFFVAISGDDCVTSMEDCLPECEWAGPLEPPV